MTDLLVAGGLMFTLPLTILGIVVIAAGLRGAMALRGSGGAEFWQRTLFHLGLFSFMFGIFSQAIGLYQAMSVIESVGNVAPELLMGGLKVSMIAPVYGLIIFLVAMLLRFGLEIGARVTHA